MENSSRQDWFSILSSSAMIFHGALASRCEVLFRFAIGRCSPLELAPGQSCGDILYRKVESQGKVTVDVQFRCSTTKELDCVRR